MRTVVIIPARLDSKRLPRKALRKVGNRHLIQWTYEWASLAGYTTFVASGDEEILTLFHGRALQTTGDCKNGTERVAEAASILQLSPDDIVINVQGDIALCDPIILRYISGAVAENKGDMVTSTMRLNTIYNMDLNKVKAAIKPSGHAHWFFRGPVPSKTQMAVNYHVGIYGMSYKMLQYYSVLKDSPWEHFESLEQMRWLYHGMSIYCTDKLDRTPIVVDSGQDLIYLEELWKRQMFEVPN